MNQIVKFLFLITLLCCGCSSHVETGSYFDYTLQLPNLDTRTKYFALKWKLIKLADVQVQKLDHSNRNSEVLIHLKTAPWISLLYYFEITSNVQRHSDEIGSLTWQTQRIESTRITKERAELNKDLLKISRETLSVRGIVTKDSFEAMAPSKHSLPLTLLFQNLLDLTDLNNSQIYFTEEPTPKEVTSSISDKNLILNISGLELKFTPVFEQEIKLTPSAKDPKEPRLQTKD